MNINDAMTDLLCRGLDDWVMAAEVASVARSLCGAVPDDVITVTSLNLVRALVEQRLMVLGDVTDGGFLEWDSDDAETTLRRAEHEWTKLGRLPGLAEAFWLQNTALGDERARAIEGKQQRR